MALFRRNETDPQFDKRDQGSGSFDDYGYDLTAKNRRVVITLAGSDPHRDELTRILGEGGEFETAISARTIEQERVDAPIVVRLFAGRRVSGPVGQIPRGLESVIDETLRRLDDAGEKARIPVDVVDRKGALRVVLRIGDVR